MGIALGVVVSQMVVSREVVPRPAIDACRGSGSRAIMKGCTCHANVDQCESLSCARLHPLGGSGPCDTMAMSTQPSQGARGVLA